MIYIFPQICFQESDEYFFLDKISPFPAIPCTKNFALEPHLLKKNGSAFTLWCILSLSSGAIDWLALLIRLVHYRENVSETSQWETWGGEIWFDKSERRIRMGYEAK